jgi:hypothetical protein
MEEPVVVAHQLDPLLMQQAHVYVGGVPIQLNKVLPRAAYGYQWEATSAAWRIGSAPSRVAVLVTIVSPVV